MDKIHKQDYAALRICAKYTRAELQVQKQRKNCEIDIMVENRLKKLGYIDFRENSKNLHHPDYVLTKEGERKYMELREIWRKDWTLYIAILALVIATLSAYYSYQSHQYVSTFFSNMTSNNSSILLVS